MKYRLEKIFFYKKYQEIKNPQKYQYTNLTKAYKDDKMKQFCYSKCNSYYGEVVSCSSVNTILMFYFILAEGTGFARGKNKNFEFFLAYNTPHECPQKNSAQSVQPFGRL